MTRMSAQRGVPGQPLEILYVPVKEYYVAALRIAGVPPALCHV